MDLEHHQAFLNTNYRVLQNPFIDIKVNQANAEFSNLKNWAFITAWNPMPDILSLEENQARNQDLANCLVLNNRYRLLDKNI
jgi:hypothetical protein